MDDPSSAQSYHHHRRLPSLHLALPSLESPEVGYLPSQHTLDPLEPYGSRHGGSKTSFATSNTLTGGKRGSTGAERSLLNASGGSLDGHANLGGHFDDESIRDGHFADTLYDVKKEEVWEEGESCENTSDNFYDKDECYSHSNDDFYPSNWGEANIESYGNSASCAAHNRDASNGRLIKQTTLYDKSAAGSLSNRCVNYCRTDSMLNNDYLEREEDYGSSCGSGEDHQHPAEVEGPWPSVSPSNQTGEGRWRGPADVITLPSGCASQKSPIGIGSSGMHIQKLDSFSEAFLSQHKRRLPLILGGDSSQQIWEFRERKGERQSCAFDLDPYLPPSSSSSSSPAHPSFLSFPSPPTSSHLVSSVLSPPPTPLPPPSLSPLKLDSPVTFGSTGHSLSQAGEQVQIFASHLQSVHSSGMVWKFPLLPRCFPQSCVDPNNREGALRSSHGRDCGNTTASNNIPQSPDSTFPASSSSDRSPHHPVRSLCPSTAASRHSSFHVASSPSHLTSQQNEGAEVITLHMTDQKVKNGPSSPNQSQQQAPQTYTGTPFPSVLHSNRGQKRGQYTPRPLLNPARTGKGLFSCISSLQHREEKAACKEEDKDCGVLPHVNIGQDFQADIPLCLDESEMLTDAGDNESPREELLWKPWGELKESTGLQDQVEKLLSMCSSSCLPGGGSNTELALHCLHSCHGDVKATLEMLLFSQPIPLRDYHYSGSDMWTDSEKSLFSAGLQTHGKDFSRIHRLVKTKSVSQCVEFYYLSKRLHDKQKKQKEEESKDDMSEQLKSVTPICQPVGRQFGLEEAVPAPSLASFFPCKLCGKMFYKIKSRNAHMKIHRQPQEDWNDRQLQQQILTQRLALGHPNNLIPTLSSDLLQSQAPALTFVPPGLHGASSNSAENVLRSPVNSSTVTLSHAGVLNPSVVTYSNVSTSNSHVLTNTDNSDSNQRQSTSVSPFHPSWSAYGQGANTAAFYYTSEGETM